MPQRPVMKWCSEVGSEQNISFCPLLVLENIVMLLAKHTRPDSSTMLLIGQCCILNNMINSSPEPGNIDIRKETFWNFECLHEHSIVYWWSLLQWIKAFVRGLFRWSYWLTFTVARTMLTMWIKPLTTGKAYYDYLYIIRTLPGQLVHAKLLVLTETRDYCW